ncbi:MAG: coproporphyrinogen dehydrogenase HemZ [Acidobacteriota bacterium]
MQIKLQVTPGYETGLHEIVRVFFPGASVSAESGDVLVSVAVEGDQNRLELRGRVEGSMVAPTACETQIEPRDMVDARRLIAIYIYQVLGQATGNNPNSYGILTGVRPVKLVHKCLDRGLTLEQAEIELQEKYLIAPEKARLLTSVAGNNRPYLHSPEEVKRKIGIYIGIPYCPTRCHYCSFPGQPLTHKPGLDAFFAGLMQEMEAVGRFLSESDHKVESIYIGGGTPTVLNLAQWGDLFNKLHRLYITPATKEITVEAGRPDTLNEPVMRVLREAGVARICINPQTMNQSTLSLIGREHGVGEIRDVFGIARKQGFPSINMDLIVGLPSEGEAEFLSSLQQVMELAPEGVTVHALARKRGSRWAMEGGFAASDAAEVQRSIDEAYALLCEEGYIPYFLYRQKYMAGNVENLGYSKPNSLCIYNIQVIEERQTIIGLGGGASSKFVNPGDWSLSSMYHPKDPASYLKSLENLVSRQVDMLRTLT